MKRIVALSAALLFSLSTVAQAVPVIIVGSYELLPNTPGQFVDIFVSGGDLVQGINFNAQIADAGPEVGGVIVGPSIEGHILAFGAPATEYNPLPTIFNPNNTGEQDVSGGLSQFLGLITTTGSGAVAANGLVARLSFDTTGFTGGTWPLLLSGTINGDTDFSGVPINIVNGDIHITPEPGSLVLGTMTFAGLIAFAVRKRRAGQASA